MLMRPRLAKALPQALWLLAVGCLMVITLLALLIVAPSTLGVAFVGRIDPGISVAGVDVGGQTVDEATSRLGTQLDAYGKQAITLRINDQVRTLTATNLGFRADARSLAQASSALGHEASPLAHLLRSPAGQPRFVPMANQDLVDDATLTAAIDRLANQIDQPATDAQLTLSPAVRLTPARAGLKLDRFAARDLVRGQLAGLRSSDLVLPTTTVQPRVTTEQLLPVQTLAQQLLTQPVVLTSGDQHRSIPAGSIRAALTVVDSPPGLELSTAPFSATVESIGRQLERAPVDANLNIARGAVTVSPGNDGRTLDRAATLASLRASLLAGNLVVPVVIQTVAPAVATSDVQSAAADAKRAIDHGIILAAGEQHFTVAPPVVSDLLQINRTSGGPWSVSLDHGKLQPLLDKFGREVQYPSLDARFSWDKDGLHARTPTVPGFSIDPATALDAIDAHWRTGSVDLPITKTDIAVDNAYLAQLKGEIKDVIAERQTSFVGSIPERANNITLAMSRIDGTIVAPGATFDFNRAVGPQTLAAGFRWGFGYMTDDKGTSKVVPSVAGGICQVATSLFQPVFWTGYTIEERHWHMFAMKHYVDQGHIGLDATVAPEDGVDFKFTNDSDHPLLIHTWTQDQQAHVALIGTRPDWTVRVEPEQIYNIKPAPKNVIKTESPLFARGREIVLEEAGGGLSARDIRHVIYPDGHERVLKLESVYEPAARSILVGTGPG